MGIRYPTSASVPPSLHHFNDEEEEGDQFKDALNGQDEGVNGDRSISQKDQGLNLKIVSFLPLTHPAPFKNKNPLPLDHPWN